MVTKQVFVNQFQSMQSLSWTHSMPFGPVTATSWSKCHVKLVGPVLVGIDRLNIACMSIINISTSHVISTHAKGIADWWHVTSNVGVII